MKRTCFAIFAVVITSALIALVNGCETTSAAQKPEITPSTAVIKVGNAVEFRASGGFEYTWSLQDDSLGRLDTRRGERVLYRSMYDPVGSNSALQVLTVSSRISGSSGTTTNSESYVQTSEAYITHIPSD